MSSRELLKRAVTLIKCLNGASWEHEVPQVVIQEIETYLAQPEPEPVAWMVENHPANDTFVNFTPNFNSHFEKLCCKVTPLYTIPPDQSAQIAALKHELQQADEDYVSVEEAYLQCQKDLYNETEKLAALQAREPLSSDQVREVYRTAFPKGPYVYTNDAFVFARMIEKAHGIGVNHE